MVPGKVPQARESGLVIKELDDELLVYDLDSHKAHCLNKTAALIWRLCDGKTTAPGIAARLREEQKSAIDEEVVTVALRRLSKANLLRERFTTATDSLVRSSRRDLMKKLALAGGLSVVSIISPTAASAATGCTVKVSCNHACISNHKVATPCPGGTADEENGKCCGSKLCVQTASQQTKNEPGTCTGAACCTTK
jgi:hypothetical protein